MEKSKLIYLAPEAIIFSFVPRERLSAEIEDGDNPWITGGLPSDGTIITSTIIDINPPPTFGPED